ncbi:hypothetical protein DFH08DRAFT_718193, partial [Mycena albidolilacea]
RQIRSQTDTIISGSMAPQFFNRVTWPNTDLDLYVTRASAALAAFFLVENGYTFDPRKSQVKSVSVQLCASTREKPPSYLGRGIADVLDFHKGDKKIQLIVATTSPMEIILSFHSTAVMNIITHDTAYSLYPWSTFVTKQALVVETVGAGQEAGGRKYAGRGWKMIRSPFPSCNSELGVRIARSVGDHFTWIISLPPISHLPLLHETTNLASAYAWELDCDGKTTHTTLHQLESPPP